MPDRLQPRNQPDNDAGMVALQDALRIVFVVLRVAAVLLIVGFCVSGIRNLEQYEKGVVLRFGAVSGPVREDPGLIIALPFPVDSVVRIPAKRTRTLSTDAFAFKVPPQEKATGVPVIPPAIKPGYEGALVTGDGGLLHAQATVKYRVRDPISWQFETADAELLLRLSLERAIVHAVAELPARTALQQKGDLQTRITTDLQADADKLRLGVDIDPIELTLSWPRQLDAVINDVVRAGSEADTTRNAARLFQSTQANQADSAAAAIRTLANADATRVGARATAESATFKELQPLYHENPDLVRQLLYQERIRRILAGVDELFVIDGGPNDELRLAIPRDARRLNGEGMIDREKPDPENGK